MDNLTIVLIIALLVLVYVIYNNRENMDSSSNLICNSTKIEEYQTNEVDYKGDYKNDDVESKYFNQLERNGDSNEHKLWLENMALEEQMQQTHECRL